MNSELLEKIVLLTEDKYLNGEVYKEKFDHYLDLYDKVNDYYDDCNKLKRSLLLLKSSVLVLNLFVDDSNVKKSKKKVISELLEISKEKVTGDFSTFLKKDSDYEVFADDFQYSALVSSDKLRNLSIIWGNADFQKLHSLESLENLRVVMGDVYLSNAIYTNGLNNLEVVTGDLHMEKLDCMSDLKNLSYVGGKIYTKNGIIDNKFKKKVKSR